MLPTMLRIMGDNVADGVCFALSFAMANLARFEAAFESQQSSCRNSTHL
jgi:hypothetical protein